MSTNQAKFDTSVIKEGIVAAHARSFEAKAEALEKARVEEKDIIEMSLLLPEPVEENGPKSPSSEKQGKPKKGNKKQAHPLELPAKAVPPAAQASDSRTKASMPLLTDSEPESKTIPPSGVHKDKPTSELKSQGGKAKKQPASGPKGASGGKPKPAPTTTAKGLKQKAKRAKKRAADRAQLPRPAPGAPHVDPGPNGPDANGHGAVAARQAQPLSAAQDAQNSGTLVLHCTPQLFSVYAAYVRATAANLKIVHDETKTQEHPLGYAVRKNLTDYALRLAKGMGRVFEISSYTDRGADMRNTGSFMAEDLMPRSSGDCSCNFFKSKIDCPHAVGCSAIVAFDVLPYVNLEALCDFLPLGVTLYATYHSFKDSERDYLCEYNVEVIGEDHIMTRFDSATSTPARFKGKNLPVGGVLFTGPRYSLVVRALRRMFCFYVVEICKVASERAANIVPMWTAPANSSFAVGRIDDRVPGAPTVPLGEFFEGTDVPEEIIFCVANKFMGVEPTDKELWAYIGTLRHRFLGHYSEKMWNEMSVKIFQCALKVLSQHNISKPYFYDGIRTMRTHMSRAMHTLKFNAFPWHYLIVFLLLVVLSRSYGPLLRGNLGLAMTDCEEFYGKDCLESKTLVPIGESFPEPDVPIPDTRPDPEVTEHREKPLPQINDEILHLVDKTWSVLETIWNWLKSWTRESLQEKGIEVANKAYQEALDAVGKVKKTADETPNFYAIIIVNIIYAAIEEIAKEVPILHFLFGPLEYLLFVALFGDSMIIPRILPLLMHLMLIGHGFWFRLFMHSLWNITCMAFYVPAARGFCPVLPLLAGLCCCARRGPKKTIRREILSSCNGFVPFPPQRPWFKVRTHRIVCNESSLIQTGPAVIRDPAMYRACTHNVINACRLRVGADSGVTADEGLYRIAQYFFVMFIKRFFTVAETLPVDWNVYLSGKTALAKARARRGLSDLHVFPCPDMSIEMHVKSDEITTKDPADKYKPRGIFASSVGFCAKVGPHCQAVANTCALHLPCWAKDFDYPTLNDRVSRYLRQGLVMHAGDHSMFETNLTPWHFSFFWSFLTHIGVDNEIISLIKENEKSWKFSAYLKEERKRVKVASGGSNLGIRCSGSPQTSVGNNFLAIFFHYFAEFLRLLDLAGISVDKMDAAMKPIADQALSLACLNNGDDFLWFDNEPRIGLRDPYYKKLGLRFEEMEKPEYCRGKFLRDGSSLVWRYVRDPREFLIRFGWSHKPEARNLSYAINRSYSAAICASEMASGIPILWAFVKRVYELTKESATGFIPESTDSWTLQHLLTNREFACEPPKQDMRMQFDEAFGISIQAQLAAEEQLAAMASLFETLPLEL